MPMKVVATSLSGFGHNNWSVNRIMEGPSASRDVNIRIQEKNRFASEGSCENPSHSLTEASKRAVVKPSSNYPMLSVCEDRITPLMQNGLTAVTIQDGHGCYQDSDSNGQEQGVEATTSQ